MQYARIKATHYAAFIESQHPRDNAGKFSASGSATTARKFTSEDRSHLREIADKADESLPHEAQQAITSFVAHPPKSRNNKNDLHVPVMLARRLEDAFSDNPSPEGKVIREQLESAMSSVRDDLRKKYGDKVTLHRAQGPISEGSGERNVLSWTFNPEVADFFANVEKVKPMSNDDIRSAMSTLDKTGEVKLRGYTFRRNEDGEIDKFESADRREDESHIAYVAGSIGEFGKHLRNTQEWVREKERNNDKKRQSIITKEVPIDDIVWLTDRANQIEAIVKNKKSDK